MAGRSIEIRSHPCRRPASVAVGRANAHALPERLKVVARLLDG
jgi:hypothetical protein